MGAWWPHQIFAYGHWFVNCVFCCLSNITNTEFWLTCAATSTEERKCNFNQHRVALEPWNLFSWQKLFHFTPTPLQFCKPLSVPFLLLLAFPRLLLLLLLSLSLLTKHKLQPASYVSPSATMAALTFTASREVINTWRERKKLFSLHHYHCVALACIFCLRQRQRQRGNTHLFGRTRTHISAPPAALTFLPVCVRHIHQIRAQTLSLP